MSEPISMEAARNAKADKCDYCGEVDHAGTFQCPRIRSVSFDNERDEITVRLWPPGFRPPPGHGP